MKRGLLVVIALAGTLKIMGCAITFSPGDYGGAALEGGPVIDAFVPPNVDASTTADGAVTPNDGGPTPPALHVLVIAGEREGADPATSDVWSAPVDATGELGPFTYLPSGPVRGPRFAATIADGRLLVATKTASDRVVESADFDGGTQLTWRTSVIANPPAPDFGQFFAGAALVAAGGFLQGEDETTYVRDFFVSTPSAGVYPKAVTTVAAKLPVGLQGASIVTSKSLVFFWGAGADPNQRAKIYSGKIDPATGATDIADRGVIMNPQAGKPHTPTTPFACAGEGHLFIMGGSTDVVLSATIDETTGAVGAWKTGPNLPGILRGAGCAVWNGKVHVFGGATGGAAGSIVLYSNKIISSTVAADGTMSPWVTSPRTLLAPRSNLFVLTY